MQPLVSISCITYNHAPFIADCLDSMLMQECNFDFEILIHDDASTDGTSEIIRKYASKYPEIIKPIIQSQNRYGIGEYGLNTRYNFPRAKGKYIAMCDGDDYWTDKLKLQQQFDFLESNPDHVLVSNLRSIVDRAGNEIDSSRLGIRGYSSCCIFFKNVFKNDIVESPPSVFNEDIFVLMYMENYGKFAILDFVGSAYRQSEAGLWTNLMESDKATRLRESLGRMLEFFKKYGYVKAVRVIRQKIIQNEMRAIANTNKSKWYSILSILSCAVKLRQPGHVKALFKALLSRK